MALVKAHLSISLDGFVAGPNQSLENPIGEGGDRLHRWMFETTAWREQHGEPGGAKTADSEVAAELQAGIGAHIMGRNMFGPGRGEWDMSWRGWWGEEPPYHTPVFVLTHQPRPPLEMLGGTTFYFVTEGIDAALEQATAAAAGKDVRIAGGASTVRQYLAGGKLDELYLDVVPVILGAGERLLEGAGDHVLEPVEVVASPNVTHIRYRVRNPVREVRK